MADVMSMDIKGLQKLQRKMEQVVSDLGGGRLLNGIRDATLILQRGVKINMRKDWHDTGRSMSSVMPQVVVTTKEIEGVVGSNVKYVPYGEFGTGIYAAPDESFVGAFGFWGTHGGSRLKKGGIKPRRMFQKALEANRDAIKRLVEGVIAKVVRA